MNKEMQKNSRVEWQNGKLHFCVFGTQGQTLHQSRIILR